MSQCGKCKKFGHNKRACKADEKPAESTSPPEPDLDLPIEKIVVARDAEKPTLSTNLERHLTDGAPAHWNVMIARGVERPVDLALAVDADHIFFIVDKPKSVAALNPQIERLHKVLYDSYVVVCAPTTHAGALDVMMKLTTGANCAISLNLLIRKRSPRKCE